MALDIQAIAEERTVEIDGVTFVFAKLPAWPRGMRLLEKIRTEIGRQGERTLSAALQSGGDGKAMGLVLMRDIVVTIMSLSEAFVADLQRDLFEVVRFRTSNSSEQKLAGAELLAFAGVDPMTVYEVTVRALVVNFFDSWQRLGSLLAGAVGGNTGQ